MKKLILSSVVAVAIFGGVSQAGVISDGVSKVVSSASGYQDAVSNGTITKFIKGSLSEAAKECILNSDNRCVDTIKEKAREIAVTATVEAVSVPATVATASALGATASTGTAISALSGAAATSATMATIGSSALGTAVSGAAAAVGIVASPAIVGAAIVTGVGVLVSWGINSMFGD